MICAISFVNILIPAGILVVIGALFALLLSYLSKKLAVKRDDRIDEVLKNLSGANCGGCGFAGCDAFATALVKGEAKVSDCPSTPKKNADEIASILGVVNDGVPTTVVVACSGGNSCKDKFEYQGYGDCNSCELLAGGRKQCPVGCMGMGTCVDACPHSAIEVNENGVAIVNIEKCVSCGMCIKECPKKLLSRIPKYAGVYIACSNNCKGKDVRGICAMGCIGCGMCERVCPQKAITMVNNLPSIDYSKCTNCKQCVEKCPVKCLKSI